MAWNGFQVGGEVAIPAVACLPGEGLALPRIVPDAAPIVGRASGYEASTGLKIRCDARAGVVEVVDPRNFRPGREAFGRLLGAAAFLDGGATGFELDLRAGSCRFRFEPGRFDEGELARRVGRAIVEATARVRRAGSGAVERPIVREGDPAPSGPDRRLCLVLGGGSLLAGFAGLLLPGVTSAPFLLLSAHYLLKASDSLRRRLLRMPKIGEFVQRLEESGGLAPSRSSLMMTVGVVILLGLMFALFHPPLPVVLALEFGVTLCFGLREASRLRPLPLGIPNIFA